MRSKLRRKNHRAVVNAFQTMNKSIANDPLWIGRFRVYLLRDEFMEYDDGSGGVLYYYAAICDLKTGECELFYREHITEWSTFYHLFMAVNDFITSIPNVIEDAKDDTINYTKVEFEPPSFRDFREARGAYNGSRVNVYKKDLTND